jgi:uncharacterized protein YndB with AHSA1/START domain
VNVLTRIPFAAALIVLTACSVQQRDAASQSVPRDEMTSVTNTVTIAGPLEAVFDLVTTARFWPQWHPATMKVGGVTERPFTQGDRILEQGRIGKLDFQTSWKVVEHVRFSRVVLQSERSSTRISYSFEKQEGGTRFTRNLDYDLKNFASIAASSGGAGELMQTQSKQAVDQLKALVETILANESSPMP